MSTTLCARATCGLNDDRERRRAIKRIGEIHVCSAIADLDRDKGDRVLVQLKAEGLSVRQIARLIGINRGIVQKASVSRETSP